MKRAAAILLSLMFLWLQTVAFAPGSFFPAKAARISLNGRAAAGTPYAEKRGERDSTSACLAWSESWVRPR